MKKVFLTIILIVSVVACTMSPMVTTAQVDDPHINDKTIATAEIKVGDKYSDTYRVLFLSNDGNDDDIEKIALVSYEKYQYKKHISGKSVPVITDNSYTHYIDSLFILDYKRRDGSIERHYGIKGSCFTRRSQRKKEDYIPIYSSQNYDNHDVYYIDKEIFDFLSQYFPKELIVKFNSKYIDGNSDKYVEPPETKY